MQIPHPLLDAWAITDGGLRQLAELYTLRARTDAPLKSTYTTSVRYGVAIIPIKGPLVLDAGYWSWLTSYELLRRDFQAALEDPQIQAILFEVDSPGGQANGCGELSTAIYEARGIKPIEAYVQGLDCSAAYEITSACDRIHIDPSAIVGSIGVKTMVVDYTKMLEKLGIVEYEIESDQSPLKIVDASKAADRARVKQMLTDMAAVFVGIVARNRGVTTDKVLKDFGRGDVLVGQAAIDAGLADELGDFETVLAGLAGERNTRSFVMANEKRPVVSGSIGDEKCDGCGRSMDDDDDTYCRACHSEADAMRSTLGLDNKAPVAHLVARISQLASFEREIMTLTGGTTPAAALGKIGAGVEAMNEVARLRAAAETQRAQQLQGEFKAALGDARLTTAHLANMVPLFMPAAEREKVKAAIAGLPSQNRDGLVAAISLGAVTPEALEQLKAFTEALAPGAALPPPKNEPPLDSKNRGAVITASKEELQHFGLSAESVEKFGNVHSVAGIVAAAKKG